MRALTTATLLGAGALVALLSCTTTGGARDGSDGAAPDGGMPGSHPESDSDEDVEAAAP